MAKQTERITLGRLLERVIHPDHHVLCVGPFWNYQSDPSPLYALHLSRNGKGEVYLLDSQSHTIKADLGGGGIKIA